MSALPVTPETAGGLKRRRPLLELFTLLTVMALTGFGLSAWQLWNDVDQNARDTLAYINQQLAQSTRATFIKHETILRVAGEELLRIGALRHPEAGRDIIEDIAAIDPGMAGFGLIRPDGQILLISGVAPGTPLPNLLQQEASAESFREALNSTRLQTGRPWYMEVLHDWVIPVRKSIRDEHGRIMAVMAAGYRITGGTTTWAELELPENVGVGVLRDDGYFQYLHFVTGREPGPDRLEEIYGRPAGSEVLALIRADGGDQGMVRLDKSLTVDNLRLVYRRVPEYGIYVTAALPEARITEEFLADMAGPASLFGVYLLLALIGYRFALRSQREHDRKLTYLAHHDVLTGLPNRALAHERLDQALKVAQRNDQRVALLFLDIDHFKEINDAHGHAEGDTLLQRVADRLLAAVRPGDTVARLGGDEFLIVLPDIRDRQSVEAPVQRLGAQFLKPVTVDGVEHHVSLSIGIAIYPDDALSVDEILQHGDIALFEAKDRGRARHVYFDAELNARSQRRGELRDALAKAVAEQQLTLHYQPQLDANSGEVVAVEALLRWDSPDHGAVAPDEFIPLAEETGLILEIGRFVMYRAIRDIQQLNRRYGLDLCVAVNVSARQMLGESLSACVRRITGSLGFPGRNLVLELTESVLIQEFERVCEELYALRRLGVGIAIDDFGTGYSSLSYLNRLPVTELKIDRSFVRDIDRDPNDRTLIASIIGLGKGQGVRLVAEGVETAEQARLLKALDCDVLQGYHFSRPLPLDQLQAYLQSTAVPVG